MLYQLDTLKHVDAMLERHAAQTGVFGASSHRNSLYFQFVAALSQWRQAMGATNNPAFMLPEAKTHALFALLARACLQLKEAWQEQAIFHCLLTTIFSYTDIQQLSQRQLNDEERKEFVASFHPTKAATSPAKMAQHLQDIPTELLQHVIEYVPVNVLKALMSVSSQYRELATRALFQRRADEAAYELQLQLMECWAYHDQAKPLVVNASVFAAMHENELALATDQTNRAMLLHAAIQGPQSITWLLALNDSLLANLIGAYACYHQTV